MRKYFYLLMLWLVAVICLPARAGIVVGGTRFVFPQAQNTLSVMIKNTGAQAYLVQTKVEVETGFSPIVATPPLLVLESQHESNIRLIRTNDKLPADRESLFYLNIAAIPSGKAPANSLQIAVRSRFKLFYRPDNLQEGAKSAHTLIHWEQNSQGVKLSNPTPYYITLGYLQFDGKTTHSFMLSPYGHQQFTQCSAGKPCHIEWQILDDIGNLLPLQRIQFPHR